jgi:chaperonin GroES
MKIRPMREYVLIRREPEVAKSKGGIIIPDTARAKTDRGEVLAIGSEVKELKVGDRVLLPKYEGQDVVDSPTDLLLKEESILAVEEP